MMIWLGRKVITMMLLCRSGLPTASQFWFRDKSNHGIWIYPLRYSREMRRGAENQSPKTGSLKGRIWALSGPLKIPRPYQRLISHTSSNYSQGWPKTFLMPTLHLQYETMFSKLLSVWKAWIVTLETWRKGSQKLFRVNVFSISMYGMAEPKADPGLDVSNLWDLSAAKSN